MRFRFRVNRNFHAGQGLPNDDSPMTAAMRNTDNHNELGIFNDEGEHEGSPHHSREIYHSIIGKSTSKTCSNRILTTL